MLQIEFMNGWIKLYPLYVLKTMNMKDVRRLAVLIVQDVESYDENVKLLRDTLMDLEEHSEINDIRIERVVKALSKKGIYL